MNPEDILRIGEKAVESANADRASAIEELLKTVFNSGERWTLEDGEYSIKTPSGTTLKIRPTNDGPAVLEVDNPRIHASIPKEYYTAALKIHMSYEVTEETAKFRSVSKP